MQYVLMLIKSFFLNGRMIAILNLDGHKYKIPWDESDLPSERKGRKLREMKQPWQANSHVYSLAHGKAQVQAANKQL